MFRLDINEKLKQLLSDRGWSEYKLAKECGLSESTIANIFRRNTIPSFTTLEAICKGFDITLAQFFSEEELVELSPELKELFTQWIPLTPEQKQAILQLLASMNSK